MGDSGHSFCTTHLSFGNSSSKQRNTFTIHRWGTGRKDVSGSYLIIIKTQLTNTVTWLLRRPLSLTGADLGWFIYFHSEKLAWHHDSAHTNRNTRTYSTTWPVLVGIRFSQKMRPLHKDVLVEIPMYICEVRLQLANFAIIPPAFHFSG